MKGALHGVRIVDLCAMITGPLATMLLADQGAEVIKVEPPGIGDIMRYVGTHRGGISCMFASCNRSKRSIAVNLKSEAGRGVVRDLVAEADVFVQNFRPGVIERLGFGEADLRGARPDLIYVSINAFGETGPWAARPAFDHILQGMTGACYIQAEAPPEFMRQAWCDKATSLTAAQAITAALFARERGAGGQHVRLSMLDVGLAFLWPDGHTNTMLVGDDDAVRLPPIASTYQPVATADGWVTVAPVTEDQWTNMLIALDRPEVLADPRFATRDARLANLQAFRDEIAREQDYTTAEMMARLHAANVPCGPLLEPSEVADFEQVLANGSLVESTHPAMGAIVEPRPAARFESTPSGIRGPAPRLGEHTDQVLSELGRSEEAIERLRAEGAIG